MGLNDFLVVIDFFRIDIVVALHSTLRPSSFHPICGGYAKSKQLTTA
jgi:hypothetical protein